MPSDQVLNPDMMPIFTGTREETIKWLKEEHPHYLRQEDYRVLMGDTLQIVSPWEFVNIYT